MWVVFMQFSLFVFFVFFHQILQDFVEKEQSGWNRSYLIFHFLQQLAVPVFDPDSIILRSTNIQSCWVSLTLLLLLFCLMFIVVW